MGYTEVLRELEDTMNEVAMDTWKKQPLLSKVATGLRDEAHQLKTYNEKRRQAYGQLTSTLENIQGDVDNQSLMVTSVHKHQFIKIAGKAQPPTVTMSDNRRLWTATALRVILQAWLPAAKSIQADKNLEHLRKKGHRIWEGKMQEDIWIAKSNKDWRTVWELCRQLGGTHRGARKRNYRDAKRTDPSTNEWATAKQASGGEGGCLAEILRTWSESPPSLKLQGAAKVDEPRKNDGAPSTDYEQKWYPSDVLATLHAFNYLKSVPTGRARKETWQMMYEKSPACVQFITTYFNLVWSSMYVPDGWQTSEAVQLDKQNVKKGTKSIRLINKLCPLGKAFFKLTQQETQETPYPFGYGFYMNRKREQAILVHHAVTGRIRKHVTKGKRQNGCLSLR